MKEMRLWIHEYEYNCDREIKKCVLAKENDYYPWYGWGSWIVDYLLDLTRKAPGVELVEFTPTHAVIFLHYLDGSKRLVLENRGWIER